MKLSLSAKGVGMHAQTTLTRSLTSKFIHMKLFVINFTLAGP